MKLINLFIWYIIQKCQQKRQFSNILIPLVNCTTIVSDLNKKSPLLSIFHAYWFDLSKHIIIYFIVISTFLLMFMLSKVNDAAA